MTRTASNAGDGYLSRHAALAWTATAALVIPLVWEFRWWRPACAGDDGAAAYAIGFPLPYARPTLVSSGEYFFMPHMLLLNLLLLALLLFPIFRLAGRRLGPKTRSAAGALALLAALPVAALWAMILAGLFIPVASIGDGLLDGGLFRYRPAFLAEALGHPPCD